MVFFFLALLFAAWTSLISMIELATRVLVDGGLTRRKALMLIGGGGFLLGIPSALSQDMFLNQDFVWSVALMISGLFFATAVLKFGAAGFRQKFLNTEDSDLRIGSWWDWAIRLVFVEALVLVVWWFVQVWGEDPFAVFGIGNLLVQWGVALAVFLLLNGWMVRQTLDGSGSERGEPPEGSMPASIP